MSAPMVSGAAALDWAQYPKLTYLQVKKALLDGVDSVTSLTGKTVSPDLYVAVAISGASQHMSGMAGSKTIIAINKDPEANMVKAARYAIIGDYKQVVPALTQEIKKLKS